MAFTNTRLWQLFQLSTIGLTILLIIDLGKVFAQTESKANSINLTANNSTITENFFVSNSLEISSPEDHAIVNTNLTINNYDVVDTDQEPKPLMFSYQANQSEEQKDVWSKNQVWDAETLQELKKYWKSSNSILLLSQQTSEPSEINKTDSNQRKAWEHEDRPLHRDSSQPGQSLAEQATDPSAILGQFQIQNSFNPSTYDADGYANTFIIQPVIPFKPTGIFPASISRITWAAIVTTPERDTPIPNVKIPGTTNIGDITWIHIWIMPITKDFRIGVGPTAVFPSAGSDRTGSGKWQLGPNFAFIYSGIPHLTLGALIEQTFSFAGDSDRPATSPLRVQPVIVYHLPKGWYFGWGDELMLVSDLSTGDFDLPLNVRVGRVFKIGDQAINMFVQPSYTPKGFQSGGKSEWSVKLNATFIIPGLLF